MKKTYIVPILQIVKFASEKPMLISTSTNNLGGEAGSGVIGFGRSNDTEEDW